MNQYSLLIPYDLKEELCSKYLLAWNPDTRLWQCGNERIYNMKGIQPYHIKVLDVHFVNKDTAKQLGCKWSPIHKKWITSIGVYSGTPEIFDALAIKKSKVISVNYDSVIDD